MSAEWNAKSEVQRASEKRQVQVQVQSGVQKVKCKRKVQKGKCRQSAKCKCRNASADREPTTHVNTLGGSDHVRIYTYPSAYGKIPHVVAENDF